MSSFQRSPQFQKGFLALVATLVISLFAAALLRPPSGATAAPVLSARIDDHRVDDVAAFETAAGPILPNSVAHLRGVFRRASFDLDAAAEGRIDVPRMFVARLPADLKDIRDVTKRKVMFFQSLLPLVLKVNEDIQAERARLWSLKSQKALGEKLDPVDRLWLIVMAERYKVKRGDIDSLLYRVDIIPPSLALAQAAEESGWGTSRFVREGNALFGEWTWSGKGIVPEGREAGKKHRIRAFNSLIDSVRSYARNINTHKAYRGLRKERAAMRADDVVLDGWTLTTHLMRYSERGEAYVKTLRSIMKKNELDRLDGAKLALNL